MTKQRSVFKTFWSLLLALVLAFCCFGCDLFDKKDGNSNTDGQQQQENENKEEDKNNGNDNDGGNQSTYVRKRGENGFIKGMDVSSVISLEEAGIKYFNEEGDEEDLFKILSDSGVTTIRVRVWNDPYNAQGKPYGGGNCNIDTAVEIGKRANKYGMDLLVNFHYSDFWADPSKQKPPKAWAAMNVTQKEEALYEFTKTSLNRLKAENIDVGMVQIGNETYNLFICGESNWANSAKLMNAGSKAVREVYPKALVAVHFTNPNKSNSGGNLQVQWAKGLHDNNVDYDVFGTSYYPFWHGTLSNLTSVLTTVSTTYNKKVMVLETSYPNTSPEYEYDTDFYANQAQGVASSVAGEPYTLQGQINMVTKVFQTVDAIENGIGVCYWEGAWISVGQDNYDTNYNKWNTYGCGWATEYASEYDSSVTKAGGTTMDNEAFFNKFGEVRKSIKVFGYEADKN